MLKKLGAGTIIRETFKNVIMEIYWCEKMIYFGKKLFEKETSASAFYFI